MVVTQCPAAEPYDSKRQLTRMLKSQLCQAVMLLPIARRVN